MCGRMEIIMDFKNYLTENVLKFWLDNALDREYGGIFTCLDEEGKIYGEEKSVWFQGRALYIFSSVYNSVEKRDEYLDAAKLIYGFLDKCTDKDGRMFFTVTRDGREIQKRRYYFSETFAAIGCAEYYLATGDEEAKEKAYKYFETAYGIFKDPSKTTPKFNPETASYKAASPAMMMLSTAQVIRKLDKKFDDIVTEMIENLTVNGNVKDFAMLENVAPDGEFVDNPTGRTVNPGHSLECAWFLMNEGIIRNDKELIKKAQRLTDVSMELGLKNGAIIAFCDIKGRPAGALEWDMQLWWPQCEAIIANRLCYEVTGDVKYKENFEKLLHYAMTHFADDKNGEWYGYLHYDGTVANTLKGNIFKGPFHLPRMLTVLWKIENGMPLM